MLEWAYSGVDFELYGNGGNECRNFLPPIQIVLETVFIVIYAVTCEIYYPWYRSVCNYKPNLELRERFGRKLLLAGLCIIWGIEIGFKLSTRQLIFILNPCHIVTFIQLILLISPPRRWVHFLFRFHTYLISGATLAIIFPVLNTRHLPFEVASYYIHHILMLIVPLYLMRLGGIYNMEPLTNVEWGFMSIGIMRLYHYLVLQPISFATNVNLNNLMCPAISDPFNGQWYRMAANFHQIFFIMLHGKLYIYIGNKFFVPKNNHLEADHTQCYEKHHQIKNCKNNLFEHLNSCVDYLDANGNNIIKSSTKKEQDDDTTMLKTCNSCSSSPSSQKFYNTLQESKLNQTKED